MVAHRRVEHPEGRGLEQEAPGIAVEHVERLAGQVVDDVPVVSVEGPHPRGGVVQPAEPERREVEAGRPALGSLDEQLDVRVAERDPLPLDEKLARLVHGEGQVVRPDLAERAACAERPERAAAGRSGWS